MDFDRSYAAACELIRKFSIVRDAILDYCNFAVEENDDHAKELAEQALGIIEEQLNGLAQAKNYISEWRKEEGAKT